jgi:putative transposase
MPRRARHYIAGHPYHIVQQGNNRQSCFIETEDYQCYLALWEEASKRYGVSMHAYCLMTNHIHLLATPKVKESISSAMRAVGSRYAQYVNRKYRRTGTLWEGRHRASLVQAERYMLSCYRYVERNPVRAGIVSRPDDYRWSSYGVNGWGRHSWLKSHEAYLGLGKNVEERSYFYRELCKESLNDDVIALIRRASHFGQPVGDDEFRLGIEAKYGISLGYMRRGRPPKHREK